MVTYATSQQTLSPTDPTHPGRERRLQHRSLWPDATAKLRKYYNQTSGCRGMFYSSLGTSQIHFRPKALYGGPLRRYLGDYRREPNHHAACPLHRGLSLVGVIQEDFPEYPSLLCPWHINKNVTAQWKRRAARTDAAVGAVVDGAALEPNRGGVSRQRTAIIFN